MKAWQWLTVYLRHRWAWKVHISAYSTIHFEVLIYNQIRKTNLLIWEVTMNWTCTVPYLQFSSRVAYLVNMLWPKSQNELSRARIPQQKKKKCTSTWKQNIRKLNKNLGPANISRSGMSWPVRTSDPSFCKSVCPEWFNETKQKLNGFYQPCRKHFIECLFERSNICESDLNVTNQEHVKYVYIIIWDFCF